MKQILQHPPTFTLYILWANNLQLFFSFFSSSSCFFISVLLCSHVFTSSLPEPYCLDHHLLWSLESTWFLPDPPPLKSFGIRIPDGFNCSTLAVSPAFLPSVPFCLKAISLLAATGLKLPVDNTQMWISVVYFGWISCVSHKFGSPTYCRHASPTEEVLHWCQHVIKTTVLLMSNSRNSKPHFYNQAHNDHILTVVLG